VGIFHDHHHHRHGAGCSHGESISERQRSTKNISVALLINMSFALIELVGGYWTNSTAIQADAIHDLGDSAALAGALLLQFVSAFPPRSGYHFGFRRLSLVSAVLTSTLLLVGSLYVVKEAVLRWNNPAPLHLNGMLGLAILGVCANGYAAWQMSRGQTQNEKAMAWHMIEDLMGWAAILFSSIVLRFWDAPWLDPALAVVIACIVLLGAARSLWQGMRLFLQAVPKSIDEEKLRQAIVLIPGIETIESLQIWSLDGEKHVCAMLVRIQKQLTFADWQRIRTEINKVMSGFGSFDSTIEPLQVLQPTFMNP
jgi:cobalt-zinc-cadmium efflux system protein